MKNPFKNILLRDPEEVLEFAFRKASEKAEKAKVFGKRVEIAKEKEKIRIENVGNYMKNAFFKMVKSFPDLKGVDEIYIELLRIYINESELKKYLSKLSWSARKIHELQRIYLKKLKGVKSSNEARNIRKEFYGRVSSIIKKLRKMYNKIPDLRELKKLPDFSEEKTIILAGLPNVGKSSLLWRLTGSRPEIKDYPFTTKGLMIGYLEKGGRRIQVIDTPGLLDRPIEKRNKIEKKAIVVLEKLADLVIYVFDVSGVILLKEQENLLKEIRKIFEKKIIIVANKTDIADKRIFEYLKEKYNPYFISCKSGEGVEELKRVIFEKL